MFGVLIKRNLMKIKNTPENKAKFFAQYWGQRLVSWKENTGKLKLVNSGYINESSTFLELKPLSSISDEDLIECYHLHSEFIAYDYTMDFKPVLEMATHWRTNGGIKDIIRCTDTVDFLRSRGYALPWMGLSVDEQIKYGWVKLSNQTNPSPSHLTV